MLRDRSFAALFTGQAASNVGTWMSIVALPFAALALAYALTPAAARRSARSTP